MKNNNFGLEELCFIHENLLYPFQVFLLFTVNVQCIIITEMYDINRLYCVKRILGMHFETFVIFLSSTKICCSCS